MHQLYPLVELLFIILLIISKVSKESKLNDFIWSQNPKIYRPERPWRERITWPPSKYGLLHIGNGHKWPKVLKTMTSIALQSSDSRVILNSRHNCQLNG